MCGKVITENGGVLGLIPGCHKDPKMCDKVVDNYSHILMQRLLQNSKCVIKLMILIHLQYNLFLINIRLKKYAIKLSIIELCIIWFCSLINT